MTEEDDEGEVSGPLVEQRLGRSGLVVKLDKGFAEGTYGVYVEYDELAARAGFAAARRMAVEYCGLLKDRLGASPGYALGEMEDASRDAGQGRKRDLEGTFLSFPVERADGRYHDAAVRGHFQLASLRAGQAWDQAQAREHELRRGTRQGRFRHRLAGLLEGEAYAHLDAATKRRLLDEVTALAFPAKGIER